MKSLKCPKCAAAITVPDGYTKAGILCEACRTPVDVRTGAVFQKPKTAAPAPAAAGDAPLALEVVEEAAPRPGIAPPSLYEMPPPALEKPNRAWLKTAIAAGIILAAAGLAIGGWMIHSKAKDREMAPVNAKWETLSVPDGWFSADLPGVAQAGQTAGPVPGSQKYTYKLSVADTNWLVEWYDLGVGPTVDIPVDFNAIAGRFASSAQYKVDVLERMNLHGSEGRKAKLSSDAGDHGLARVLRRGNRLYFMAVTGLTTGNLAAGERFLGSLKLLPVVYTTGVAGAPEPLGFKYKQGERMDFFEENEASRSAGIHGGTPPYALTLQANTLPQGLKAATAGGNIVVSGTTAKPGDYTVGFTVVDQADAKFTGVVDIHVEANPFTITCDPKMDEQGRVVVDARAGVRIRLVADGPAKDISGEAKWYVPFLPTGLESKPELDGLAITGPPWTGENTKITVEWSASGKDGRSFKRKLSFKLVFKEPAPPPPEPEKPKDG